MHKCYEYTYNMILKVLTSQEQLCDSDFSYNVMVSAFING